MFADKESKKRYLLAEIAKTKIKLQEIQKGMTEEKNNEEAWAGHDGVSVLQLQQDYDLTISHLDDLEKALKELENYD